MVFNVTAVIEGQVRNSDVLCACTDNEDLGLM